jgi:hypothetical protein
MPTEKFYLDGNFEKSIDFHYIGDNEICIGFYNEDKSDCQFELDLDLVTFEKFILDLQFELQKIKNEGGKNG